MRKSSEIASSINKKAILELLREKGPLSKADISRELGLSFPAVSYNAKKLLEDHLIYELGAADNALGRKGLLLAFNARKAYLVGIDIARNNIRCMCSNIGGEIRSYHTRRMQKGNVVQQVIESVYLVIQEAGVSVEDVICMGLGVPGIYDSRTDSLKLAPFAESWRDAPLVQRLKEEFKLSITVENSVNLGAIGERWKGVAKGYDDVLYVDLGVGIGSAVLVDGHLLKGKNGAFGEIAYMILNKDELSTCFQEEGVLERLIPSRSIDELYRTEPDLDIRSLLQRLDASDPTAQVHDIPTYFAMALVNAISMTNPELLVIAGRLGCAIYQGYKHQIDTIVRENVPFPPVIKCTGLAEKANVLGAIALAMLEYNRDVTEIGQFS